MTKLGPTQIDFSRFLNQFPHSIQRETKTNLVSRNPNGNTNHLVIRCPQSSQSVSRDYSFLKASRIISESTLLKGCTSSMEFRKCTSFNDAPSLSMMPMNFSNKVHARTQFEEEQRAADHAVVADVDIDLREVYFLIMHFLSTGPCQRTFGQFWNELMEHQLLPRRYHAWYSRTGVLSGNENDDGISFPLNYNKLVERYPHIEKDHLVKLLKQLILSAAPPLQGMVRRSAPSAADVPTLLGSGPFSILGDRNEVNMEVKLLPAYLRWPHMQADQVRGLSLREIGGGFPKHHRAPSIRFACYAIAKPLTMVQKMQNIKKLRGHRDAVYCAIFDRLGRYVITGSDDRLVKIWSMETAFCLASCRGHEGDITDLAVSSNNVLVASASNDYSIRVWHLPDGLPISVLRGHIGAVTAIAFSPRPNSVYQLLSSSDDGTCRIWDARYSQCSPRIYLPKPTDAVAGKSNGPSSNGPSSSNGPQCHQILCCAYNANGTVFVTGSSDTFARVWSACKSNTDDSEQPNYEIDLLAGHENDVNYVQFSGCAVASRSSTSESYMEEKVPKFKNSWFSHDNIVTCSRDGSAIIWIPRSRRSHGKAGRWTRAYHLKVPPPPMPPQPPRGGPRQRFLPTPRGVNMIVWSLDNRFVLAAIMDCRICVWNASDGSLVHSLTGHSESTYVLDVHPFNPRIAMSAGYDGKTIVWDIWEGTPIRIYEIGRFKLVDGKFSPDGTKTAKYDQFFLGDYRPLIQDSHGNVLDQETQLAPYRRNMQDPLCDPSMIPYPEPYQSMYQKRRLGALGIEWRPSSVKFAIGTDIGLGPDFQVLPLADLDGVIEPLPEFIDAMYWEPENDVINDDTDSEYNVAEEYSSEGEQESLSASSSSDPECSAEDNKVEQRHKDGLRRSKRKKHEAGVELMTSSGRRVKRRNLDEHDDTSSRSRSAKKSKNEASKDGEDEGGSDDDSSESESMLQDSHIQSKESNGNLRNVQQIYSIDEQASFGSEDVVKAPKILESQTNAGNRRRLVLKFSLRDSKKSVPSENTRTQCENQADLASASRPKENLIGLSSGDPGSSFANVTDVKLSENNRPTTSDREEAKKVEGQWEASSDYKESKISWGEVKLRTSKRMKSENLMSTDAFAGFSSNFDVHSGNKNNFNDYVKPENEYGNSYSGSEVQNHGGKLLTEAYRDDKQFGIGALEDKDSARNKEFSPLEDAHKSSLCDSLPLDDQQQADSVAAVSCNGNLNKGDPDCFGSDASRGYDLVVSTNELKENPPPKPTKLRIKSKKILGDPKGPFRLKIVTSVDVPTGGRGDFTSESPSSLELNPVSGLPEDEESPEWRSSIQRLHSDSNMERENSVYKRIKSNRARTNLEGYGGDMRESTSKASSHNHVSELECPEATTEAIRRTRSMGLKATSWETNAVNHNFRVREECKSVGTSQSLEKSSKKAFDQLPSEDWTSGSKMTRSRSTRNKDSSYYDNDPSSSAERKSHYTPKKSNWLMLSEQEEGYRYVPQLGDEVAYLRQGHQEYIESSHSSMNGPWVSIKENIRAVEFCLVEGLDYATLPGSGESCCKLTLKFIDTSSSVSGKRFKMTLPDLINFPDFVVEKTWYDAAMRRNWTSRDKCMVWWRDGVEEGGSWWEGRIISSKDKSSEFPGSPWERYIILYKSDTESHLHSPWELHDPKSQWEPPHIDSKSRNKLLSSFAKLQQSTSKTQDIYGILKMKQVAQKLDFVNRFPVPLCPEIIQVRLENDYYRSLEAVEHDREQNKKKGSRQFAAVVGTTCAVIAAVTPPPGGAGYMMEVQSCGTLSEQLVSMKEESMGIMKDFITKHNVPNDVPDEPDEVSSEDEG
ncbi:hypothetical protein F0562_000774 [Nyssa sinensis]|uniref:Uncharacterized protein n=1 Tax=Nyssa sinensis TaxID=561372 RepID=A0A5J5C4R5_9ASTE|nr:hypothetical protein F0562_000774 [Nyssa sinensis]